MEIFKVIIFISVKITNNCVVTFLIYIHVYKCMYAALHDLKDQTQCNKQEIHAEFGIYFFPPTKLIFCLYFQSLVKKNQNLWNNKSFKYMQYPLSIELYISY